MNTYDIYIYTCCTLSNQICHLSATNPHSLASTRCGPKITREHHHHQQNAMDGTTQVADIHSQTWRHDGNISNGNVSKSIQICKEPFFW